MLLRIASIRINAGTSLAFPAFAREVLPDLPIKAKKGKYEKETSNKTS